MDFLRNLSHLHSHHLLNHRALKISNLTRFGEIYYLIF